MWSKIRAFRFLKEMFCIHFPYYYIYLLVNSNLITNIERKKSGDVNESASSFSSFISLQQKYLIKECELFIELLRVYYEEKYTLL